MKTMDKSMEKVSCCAGKPRIEAAIRVLAGSLVLVGLALGTWWHPGAYLLSAFVGINLIQSSFTWICPAAMIFKRLGFKE